MTQEQTAWLNDYFLHTFGKLLSYEEANLRKNCAGDLSIRELHVIEAVERLEEKNENTMASTAHYLGVSPGSLTTAVNVLVKKGYLERNYTMRDRRVIYISATAIGKKVCGKYVDFVTKMVEYIGNDSEIGNDESIALLIKMLSSVAKYLNEDITDKK